MSVPFSCFFFLRMGSNKASSIFGFTVSFSIAFTFRRGLVLGCFLPFSTAGFFQTALFSLEYRRYARFRGTRESVQSDSLKDESHREDAAR